MNNYEKVKNMTVEELAEFLNNNAPKFVYAKVAEDFIKENITVKWLKSEVKENV